MVITEKRIQQDAPRVTVYLAVFHECERMAKLDPVKGARSRRRAFKRNQALFRAYRRLTECPNTG